MSEIAGIVLAAGGSTRLGYAKQLIEHEGTTLVRRAAAAVRDAGAHPVVVVVGAEVTGISAALDGLEDVVITMNPQWKSGLASSLTVGIARVREATDAEGVVIVLADQPRVDSQHLTQLIAAFDATHRILVSGYDGTIGVPALIGREYFGDLMELEGDRGAGAWLRSRRAEVTEIPLPEPMLDIDTEDDVTRLRALEALITEKS